MQIKFKLFGLFVSAVLLVLAGCNDDQDNASVEGNENGSELKEETVDVQVLGDSVGNFDVNFSYQPGGNMDMPAAADLPIKLDLSTVNPDKDLVGHVNYNILVENAQGELVYEVNGAHEHEGYHEFVIGPLPEGEYSVDVAVTPTPDTPEDDQFEEMTREFEFATMAIGAEHEANLSVGVSDAPVAGELSTISFTIEDEDGEKIPHTDNLLQIIKDDVIVYQATNLHTHVGEFEVDYTFPESGTYEITLTSYPTPMRASVNFAPVGETFTVEVD